MTYKRKIWAKINAAAAEISWLLVKAAVLRSSLPGKCLWNSMPQVGNAGFLFKCVASSPDWDKTNDITMTSSGLFSQSSLQSHSRQGTHCFHALLVTNMWKKRWSAPLKKFTFPGRKAGQANQLIKTKNRVCFEIALVSGSSWCWCYNNLLNLEFPLKFPPQVMLKLQNSPCMTLLQSYAVYIQTRSGAFGVPPQGCPAVSGG